MSKAVFRIGAAGAVVIALALSAQAAKKLSKADKKWLEEDVAALITSEEVRIFENLDSDKERQIFKELFWARRDPKPMTPQNEFKEEWESRVATADRNFKTRSGRGSSSDMGKFFLVLGPPQKRSGSGGGGGPTGMGSGGAGTATPNAGAGAGEDPGGEGGAAPLSGGDEGGAASQIWTYDPNERLGIPQGLSVEFRSRAGFGFRAVTSKELDQALDVVKGRYVYNPLINYARDDQGHLKPPPAEADPNSPSKKILQAMTETKTATPDIDFKLHSA